MQMLYVVLILMLSGCAKDVYTVRGVAGANGAAAQPCSVAPSADGAVITCPDGSSQSLHNGVDASVVPVQLCAGSLSQFPEVALCINNALYAVYWDGHNAWMTLIPPGHYNSTSSTAACSFNVGASCQVSF